MQFLFDRLDNTPQHVGETPPPFNLKSAIQTQVERIVGARLPASEAGVMASPQFGMPSVIELSVGDAQRIKAYVARLTRMLLAYEPRLLQPSVKVEDSGDPLLPYHLVVSGKFAPDQPEAVYTFPLGQR
jgi:predicted component of type VI protein secretion system